jgi:hypothetical protein
MICASVQADGMLRAGQGTGASARLLTGVPFVKA